MATPLPAEVAAPIEQSPCVQEARALGFEVSASEGIGQGRWATWTEEWTLTDASGRKVSLTKQGGGGSVWATAWVEGHPSEAELQVLLRCASIVEQTQRPEDALSRAPRLVSSEAASALKFEGYRVELVADRPIPWSLAPVALVPQRESWRRDDSLRTSHPQSLEHCPCWTIFRGDALGPLDPQKEKRPLRPFGTEPFPGVVIWTTPWRNPSYAFGIEVRDQVRWVGVHYGPARVLGQHGATTWIAGHGPEGGAALRLFAVDTASSSITALTVQGAWLADSASIHPQRGIPVQRDETEVWLSWEELASAMASPGTAVPAEP